MRRRLRGVALAECRGCHEPIRFVRLNTGSVMPVNPARNNTSNVAAIRVGNQLHGHVISKDHPAGPSAQRFTPHAATCEAVVRRARQPKPPPDPALF